LLFELYEEVTTGEGNPIKYSRLTPYETDEEMVELYHTHLPKLEGAGYVDWNEAEKTVQRGSRWDEIEPILELIYSHLCGLPLTLQGKPPSQSGMQS
jgi:hypothetical protein